MSYHDSHINNEDLNKDNEKEVLVDEEEVKLRILGMGVNSISNSYDNADKKLMQDFLSLPLKNIFGTWDFICDKAKIDLISIHKDEFVKWINDGK